MTSYNGRRKFIFFCPLLHIPRLLFHHHFFLYLFRFLRIRLCFYLFSRSLRLPLCLFLYIPRSAEKLGRHAGARPEHVRLNNSLPAILIKVQALKYADSARYLGEKIKKSVCERERGREETSWTNLQSALLFSLTLPPFCLLNLAHLY